MWTTLCLLGLAGLSQAVHVDDEDSLRSSWGYQPGVNGPDTWATTNGGDAGSCDGTMQSPIDLDSSIAMVMSPGEINMNGYNLAMAGEATNNGHSLAFTFTGGVAPYITGGRLPAGERFDFIQLHWHWGSTSDKGSEHTMDGKAAPIEIHLVHWNTKYADLTEAAGNSDGLAVIGVFYEVDSADNPNLAGILDVVKTMRRRQKRRKGQGKALAVDASAAIASNLKLDDFLPADRADYYYYQGSLTTPSCNEVVRWTNLMNTVKISEAQLNIFRSLVDADGLPMVDNFRPPQPLNPPGRQVATPRMLFTTKAASATATDPFTAALASLFSTGFTALLITGVVSLLAPPPAQVRAGFEAEQHLRHGQRQWWQ